MIRTHDEANARQELERALLRADNLGLKPLVTRAHYLLAVMLRKTDQTAAQQHYRAAFQLLNEMAKEPGAEKILQRSDLKTIYDEAQPLSQAAAK
jgi:hypothetical protein